MKTILKNIITEFEKRVFEFRDEEIFNCNLKEITDVKNWMGGLIIKNGIQSKMYHSTLELKPYFENKKR